MPTRLQRDREDTLPHVDRLVPAHGPASNCRHIQPPHSDVVRRAQLLHASQVSGRHGCTAGSALSPLSHYHPPPPPASL